LAHVLGRFRRRQLVIHADKHEVLHRGASQVGRRSTAALLVFITPTTNASGRDGHPPGPRRGAAQPARGRGSGKWQTAAARLNAGAWGSLTTRNQRPRPSARPPGWPAGEGGVDV